MRAKDFIEINCKYQFYNELQQAINELSKFRLDKNATENYVELYFYQDRKYKRYRDDLRDWKLNNLDESQKPIYDEIINAIPYRDAFNFRNHLFNVIEGDKSFGYLFYFLASEKNRSEIFYQNNPIDCIPDKNIIEENIKNYQDDYPKHNLETYLTYCDFNYSFYKSHKVPFHTQELWLTVFNQGYAFFDILRTKMHKPFIACDIIKEYFVSDKTNIVLIVPLVIDLLEQYNFDLTDEQIRCKRILIDEIRSYYDSYNQDFFTELKNTGNDSSNEYKYETELEINDDILPENYIQNGGIITTGSYEISELYRYFSNKNAPNELFLVDKLEISLAHYATNYKQNCDNYWGTYKFDQNYFNEFIPGELLTEFNLQLHDHIKPLNNHEVNRYLTASLQQFKTHSPEKRKDAFCEIYHDVYWYPNDMKYTGSSARDNYVLHVWKLFSNHFQLFQEATQNTFDIFKATLTIGSTRIIPEVENGNSIKENKSEVLKSILSRNGFLELSKVNSLSHDGQLKLIEMITLNDTPYNVALFEFIGFFKYLEFEKSLSKVAIHKKISEIFKCSADTIKGNMLSLNDYSKIDKTRYTAHLHKEKVKTDYYSLK